MSFFDTYGERLIDAIQIHLFYVLSSVLIGFFIALILGILLSRIPRYAKIIMPLLSIFQTIPGIVFVGVLFLYLGMVPATVIIALAVYAIFPVLKNTYTGLMDVKPEYIEAAKGCGMSQIQTLLEVELPLATPSIITGLRMSTIYTVSWSVLAAMIGLGGLGEFIYIGIASNNNAMILVGAIPSAIMAIVLSLLIDVLRRFAIPKGLRSLK
ncbi:ABC transporter permease [Acetobacterium bakii]|uniref:Choline ABC transporter permease n=1 Tax=Acetobacterium bakii TaxID=52689 RepID=A0A0L6U122_9FIRM|nr:ABC transporter permease [Acetobacterium bakii]KNZ41500.1 choline ABC transporter permease [Acetobacterium bakii]